MGTMSIPQSTTRTETWEERVKRLATEAKAKTIGEVITMLESNGWIRTDDFSGPAYMEIFSSPDGMSCFATICIEAANPEKALSREEYLALKVVTVKYRMRYQKEHTTA